MDISAEVAAIQAASQGSELRQPLVGALNKLNSGSLPAVTASDVGKILKVGASGWEVGEKSGYMPVPSASLNISTNNTYDVTNYAEAVVDVQPSGKINITQNGTDIDVANYALADVAVSGGATLVRKTITQNGTYDPTDDNADGYSEVVVSVNFENSFQVGTLDANGSIGTDILTRLRSSGFTHCESETEYRVIMTSRTISPCFQIRFYQYNDNTTAQLSQNLDMWNTEGGTLTFTTPQNANYLKFLIKDSPSGTRNLNSLDIDSCVLIKI